MPGAAEALAASRCASASSDCASVRSAAACTIDVDFIRALCRDADSATQLDVLQQMLSWIPEDAPLGVDAVHGALGDMAAAIDWVRSHLPAPATDRGAQDPAAGPVQEPAPRRAAVRLSLQLAHPQPLQPVARLTEDQMAQRLAGLEVRIAAVNPEVDPASPSTGAD